MISGVFELAGGCVLGVELAHNLGVAVGDSVVIALPFGEQLGLLPRAKKVALRGIFDFGYYDYNATMVYMDLSCSTKSGKSLFRGWVSTLGKPFVPAKWNVAEKASAMAMAGKTLSEPAMGPENIMS